MEKLSKMQEISPTEFQDENIYRDIVSAIASRQLQPGMQLKEADLKDIYRVSRTRIREVLLRLSHDQFVSRISHRGAFVAKPSITEAREVFAARSLIEGRLVAQLANREYRPFIPLLERQIQQEDNIRQSGDFTEIMREGAKFHTALAEIANNSIIGAYVEELLVRSSLIGVLYQTHHSDNCELDEHRQLVNFIAEGRASDAENLMVAHIDGILQRLDLSVTSEPELDIRNVLGGTSVKQ